MKLTRHPRRSYYVTMVIALVMFVTLNMLANRLLESTRIDVTENKLFTLSSGTKKVLGNIDEPLKIQLFFTQEAANGYPVIQNYAARIKGVLKQYVALSNGKLKLEISDPEPFSEQEDTAVAQGVRAVTVDQNGNKILFGLSITNAVDQALAIPFLNPERQAFLEYDITRMIDRLSHQKKTTLGILSWLPMRGTSQSLMAGQGPWAIFQQMEEFFSVEVLKTDVAEIPSEIGVLLVVHPAPISDETLYAIDQFMMRGGKAVFLIDPHTEIEDVPEKTSSLEPLLSHWGVKMRGEEVAGDMDAAIRVGTSNDVSTLGAAPNVTWLLLKKSNFNAQEILSAELNTMIMPTVGVLEKTPDATTQLTPLITTGEQSFLIAQEKLMFARQDPTLLMRGMTPSDHPLILAAKVEGTLSSAFAGRTEKNHLDRSTSPASFVVVADTDFLRDGFWVQTQQSFGSTMFTPSADNGAFLLNAIDYLSGDSALLSLRTRTTDERRFEVVERLRRDAEANFREKEEQLRERLRNVESQLSDVQTQENGALVMSDNGQSKLDDYRHAMTQTRRELRQVQHELRRDIESLGWRLKLIHVGLIPLCVLLLGLWLPRRLGMKRG